MPNHTGSDKYIYVFNFFFYLIKSCVIIPICRIIATQGQRKAEPKIFKSISEPQSEVLNLKYIVSQSIQEYNIRLHVKCNYLGKIFFHGNKTQSSRMVL